jgi:hypothetical protein
VSVSVFAALNVYSFISTHAHTHTYTLAVMHMERHPISQAVEYLPGPAALSGMYVCVYAHTDQHIHMHIYKLSRTCSYEHVHTHIHILSPL